MFNQFLERVLPHSPTLGGLLTGHMALLVVGGMFSVTVEVIRWKRDVQLKRLELGLDK